MVTIDFEIADGKRGFTKLEWGVVSMSHDDEKTLKKIGNVMTDTNSGDGAFIKFPGNTFKEF